MPSKMHKCSLPECSNLTVLKNKYCSPDCLAKSRLLTPTAVQQAKLEDRLLSQVSSYLAKHPARSLRMASVVKKGGKAAPHEMVLMLSDAHYPEVVDPEVAMGIAYNAEICFKRIERVRNVTVRYKQLREESYPIRKLTVAMLGDMLSGDIHEELEVSNQFPLAESLVNLAYYLHDMFLSLAKEFPEVEVVVIPGNHPRQFKKPRFKAKTITNFEYILGHFIASLAGTSYKVTVPKDLVYVHEVCGQRIGMTHGDGVQSNSFAGIPWYGIKQRQDALQSLMRHLGNPGLDYLLMGHFHRPTMMVGTDSTVLINGAVKGGDEYSLGTRLSATDPTQLLLTFHDSHGLVDVSQISLRQIV